MKRPQHLPATGCARGALGLPASGSAKGDRGFTLIEVLVAIVILAVLSAIAAPGFMRLLPDYQLKGATRDLYSNLQLIKGKAIRDRGQWAIVFDEGGNSYQIVSGGPDGRFFSPDDGDNVVVRTVSLSGYGGGLRYGPGGATRKVGKNEAIKDIVTYPHNRVVFNSLGLTPGTLGGYVYLQNDRNASYAVGTWSTGIVVLRKWNGSAWE